MKKIKIGSRFIGSGLKPMIIAEMSGNHNGSLENAIAIVKAASACGADAIKLQTFTPQTLTVDSSRPEFFINDSSSLWNGRRLWDLYAEAHTPWEWHEPIFNVARKEGMTCISTAFDFESLNFLVSIGVDALKISSFELIHIPLIDAASRLGKPLFLSTGMSTIEELDEAVSTINKNDCSEFVLLKCTSAYPSQEKHANVLTMADMSQRYNCCVGFSDHTLSPYASYASVALGSVAIEKHFTLSRKDGGVDAAFSIEPQELTELTKGSNLIWESLGKVVYEKLNSENISHQERPSIYVVKKVKKGEIFTSDNIRIIRPSNGLAPKYYTKVLGKRCKFDIDSEMPTSWNMIE